MAIFVVLATVAGIVIVAITTSGNEDLEASGKTDLDAACAPNEIRNQDLESRGIRGNHPTITGLTSNNIGCLPHCATWEYPSKGPNKEGKYEYDPSATSLTDTIGGPDGADGVYSTNTGCFAPCYWRNLRTDNGFSPNLPGPKVILGVFVPSGAEDTGLENTLSFDNSNRPPRTHEIRFGVVYSQDNQPRDYHARPQRNMQMGGMNNGVANGRRLNTENIDDIEAYTHKPAWRLGSTDTGVELEVRADPDNETCTIVDITNNRIVCSSLDDDCYDRGYPLCLMDTRVSC